MGLPPSKDRARLPVRHDHTAGDSVAGRAVGAGFPTHSPDFAFPWCALAVLFAMPAPGIAMCAPLILAAHTPLVTNPAPQ